MDVDTYLSRCPEDQRDTLVRLRSLCRETLVGFEEGIVYGMPSYSRDGDVEVAFASRKSSITLYVLRQDALAVGKDSLSGFSVGKGAIRYPKPEAIDLEIVRQMLEATRDASGPIC